MENRANIGRLDFVFAAFGELESVAGEILEGAFVESFEAGNGAAHFLFGRVENFGGGFGKVALSENQINLAAEAVKHVQANGFLREAGENALKAVELSGWIHGVAFGICQRVGNVQIISGFGEPAVDEEFFSQHGVGTALGDFQTGVAEAEAVGVGKQIFFADGQREIVFAEAEDVNGARILQGILVEIGNGNFVEPRRD